MSRQIRMVSPNYEHPKYAPEEVIYDHQDGAFKPLLDGYQEAYQEYKLGREAWSRGMVRKHNFNKDTNEFEYVEEPITNYLEYPYNYDPNKGFCKGKNPGYRPVKKDYMIPDVPQSERTWYQLFQTVSEGSPVSPPFATPEELAQWLTEHGSDGDDYPVKSHRARRYAEEFDFFLSQAFPNQISQRRAQKANHGTYEGWLKFINGPGWMPSMMGSPTTGLITGAALMESMTENSNS